MKEFPRILLVSVSCAGGAGIAARRLLNALRAEGYAARLLVLDGDASPDQIALWHEQFSGYRRKMRKAWRALALPLIAARQAVSLRGRAPGAEIFSFLSPLFDVTKHPWYLEADVVHFHWAASLFPWRRALEDKAVAVTLHDINWLTGGCHYADSCEGFLTECVQCPQLSGTRRPGLARDQFQLKKRFLQRHPGWVKAIIGPSDWIAGQSRLSSLWRNTPAFVIPNAHDQKLYRPLGKSAARRLLNLPEDAATILIVGQSLGNRRKGFDLVSPLLSDPRFHWILVGQGSASEAPNVHSLGVIHDERLMAIVLNAAEVLVVPSREENYSNVILEARLCGTPVVAFDIGGNRDAVRPGIGGTLAGELSTSALLSAIETEMAEARDPEGVSRAAAAEVGGATVALAHVKLYQSIIQKEGPVGPAR